MVLSVHSWHSIGLSAHEGVPAGAREVFRHRHENAYRTLVEVPAAMLIQATWRMFAQWSLRAYRRRAWLAATLLAAQWRQRKAYALVAEAWRARWLAVQTDAALRMQCLWRRRMAQKEMQRLRLITSGKRIYAARVILRAWLRTRDAVRFRGVKEAWAPYFAPIASVLPNS